MSVFLCIAQSIASLVILINSLCVSRPLDAEKHSAPPPAPAKRKHEEHQGAGKKKRGRGRPPLFSYERPEAPPPPPSPTSEPPRPQLQSVADAVETTTDSPRHILPLATMPRLSRIQVSSFETRFILRRRNAIGLIVWDWSPSFKRICCFGSAFSCLFLCIQHPGVKSIIISINILYHWFLYCSTSQCSLCKVFEVNLCEFSFPSLHR